MPTPVSVARQCLTQEAAHALDEAVNTARRRGHAHTTSLHAVSALLSLPKSTLREACARVRNTAYTPRLQFKALDLCLSVSLERIASSQGCDDPPVSNSLMAAIKRSQANQRRQPESFHLYNQISNQSSITAIKVELKHLLLSILDDPLVSRVLGEAGFRSTEIKLALVRPLPPLFKYSQSKSPPVFLCNTSENSGLGSRGFSFPFSRVSSSSWDGDENCRRIGEVLSRQKCRNPLLVGVCANEVLRTFVHMVENRIEGALPSEISSVTLISIEKDVLKLRIQNFDEGLIDLVFEDMTRTVERSEGRGCMVNVGDLKALVGDEEPSGGAMSFVVVQLTRFLEINRGKVWLIGATASYETYLKFVTSFPSVEKDWDLQLLPITSLRPSMAELHPRSSLMESFVPFGGFFTTPSDLKSSLNLSYQGVSRCNLCNARCEQEVLAVSRGGFVTSVADQYQASLPSWLQMTELGIQNRMETKDEGESVSTKILGLQKKWNSICQHLHQSQPFPQANLYQVDSQCPKVVGFQVLRDKIENAETQKCNNAISAPNVTIGRDVNSSIPISSESLSISQLGSPQPVVSNARNRTFLSTLLEKPSSAEDNESCAIRSSGSLSNSSLLDGSQLSPTSATSVTTDLGLGRVSPPSIGLKKPTYQTHEEFQEDFLGSFSGSDGVVNECISYIPAKSSSPSCHEGPYDVRELKALSRALTERASWQSEAISVICRILSQCHSRDEKCSRPNLRQDVWFNFVGPDRLGKRNIAVTLAEVLFGSKECFISVDLCSQDGIIDTSTNFDCEEINGYDVKFRGKTTIDYVAEELSKKPSLIVFLENVDKADVMSQNSLSQAIRTGKFSDSHGREVGINNAIFVTTSAFAEENRRVLPGDKPSQYSVDRILRAKVRPMQILVENSHRGNSISPISTARTGIVDLLHVNKRKLVSNCRILEQLESFEMAKRAHKASTRCLDLDLNLPAEDMVEDTNAVNSEKDYASEISRTWLQDFIDRVDEEVVFKPCDFEALANKIFKDINESFHNIVGSDCLLELDSEVLEQLLAAAYLSNRIGTIEDWVEQVLSRGFADVQKRYQISVHSVVKLVTCEGICLEENAARVSLPTQIIVN